MDGGQSRLIVSAAMTPWSDPSSWLIITSRGGSFWAESVLSSTVYTHTHTHHHHHHHHILWIQSTDEPWWLLRWVALKLFSHSLEWYL